MTFLLGLCFRQHTVERWESVGSGQRNRPVSQRRHVLAFTCEELDIDYFSPVGKVNDEYFLGVEPGYLFCENVVVTKLPSVNGQPAPDEAHEEVSQALWLLEYQLVEAADRRWILAVGDDPASAFPMTAFFGREDFHN